MKKFILPLLAALLVSSCDKADANLEALGPNSEIIGSWVETGAEGDQVFFGRTAGLDHDAYAFSLDEDGVYTEHVNAGFCATPPITYTNYEGTWEAVSDSLLNIVVAYWGGSRTFQMRILSLEGDALAIRYLFTEDMTNTR